MCLPIMCSHYVENIPDSWPHAREKQYSVQYIASLAFEGLLEHKKLGALSVNTNCLNLISRPVVTSKSKSTSYVIKSHKHWLTERTGYDGNQWKNEGKGRMEGGLFNPLQCGLRRVDDLTHSRIHKNRKLEIGNYIKDKVKAIKNIMQWSCLSDAIHIY